MENPIAKLTAIQLAKGIEPQSPSVALDLIDRAIQSLTVWMMQHEERFLQYPEDGGYVGSTFGIVIGHLTVMKSAVRTAGLAAKMLESDVNDRTL
jgi:hypothetical protein